MKKYCFLIISLLMGVSSMQVTSYTASQDDLTVLSQEPQSDKPLKRVEVMPTYPGGSVAILDFISKNIRYPEDAKEAGRQGIVVCEFVINKDGSFSGFRIKRSVYPSLDQEAIRVIKSFPKWIPGTNNGEPVRVLYTLPVAFRLKK